MRSDIEHAIVNSGKRIGRMLADAIAAGAAKRVPEEGKTFVQEIKRTISCAENREFVVPQMEIGLSLDNVRKTKPQFDLLAEAVVETPRDAKRRRKRDFTGS